MPHKKTVSIMGCGWYGLALAEALLAQGIAVKGSTTTAGKLQVLTNAGIDAYLVDFAAGQETYDPSFFDCDILWICIPPKVRSGNGDAYIDKIKRIIQAVNTHRIRQVVLISSTGVYGELNTEVNELDETKPDSESGKALLYAEDLLKAESAFTTTIIRFAGLIGPGRHPGRFFAGKQNIPNGNVPVNLIHLTDCIGISQAIVNKSAFGYTFNACSPDHPDKADFYTEAAACSGLNLPCFIKEKNGWKIVNSVYTDTVLKYSYAVDNLMKWLGSSKI